MAEIEQEILLEKNESGPYKIRTNVQRLPKDQALELQQVQVSYPESHSQLALPINCDGLHCKLTLVRRIQCDPCHR